MTETTTFKRIRQEKQINYFERYLTLWVVFCMATGLALGKLLPRLTDSLRHWEFGDGSQINIPIAVLIGS